MYESRGVNRHGNRLYRPMGLGSVCKTKDIAEKVLNKHGYYQNSTMGNPSRYFNSHNLDLYAIISRQQCLTDDLDIALSQPIGLLRQRLQGPL